MTSNCDVTNSAHQIQMTTIFHWLKPPMKTFCVRHCAGWHTVRFLSRLQHYRTNFHSPTNFWEILGACKRFMHTGSSWKALAVVVGVRCWRSPLAGRQVTTVYSCSEDCVPVDGVKSSPFIVGVWLRQWCLLSPLLFIVYIKVLHTTARGPNPTCEAISPGCKRHFGNNEKIYSRKTWWFGRMQDIPKKSHDSRYLALELLCNSLCGLPQKNWRVLVNMNWVQSRRRSQMPPQGCHCWNCRMNCLLYPDELVLHARIFSTGSSVCIWSVVCCVWPRRNENQLKKDWDIMSLETPKAVFSASVWKYTAAGGDFQVAWRGIHEWRKSEKRDSYTDW